MRREFIYIGFTILLIVYLYLFHVKEGFESTIEMTQDRANPLAAQQQPLTNPAVNIGISQGSGTNIRQLSQVALNSPLEDSVFNGTTAFGLKSEQNINTISPRIDNEDSYLGLIKFCKDTVDSSGKDAWQNAKFRDNCGICMTDTSILLDRLNPKIYNSSNGTGVLVYKEDKDIAYTSQSNNNFRYPRAIPSLRSASCLGASLTDDSRVPVLAINSNMYAEMSARNSCIHGAAFKTDNSGSCGQCQSKNPSLNGNWSYIKSTSLNPLSLTLFGSGTATVKVKGVAIGGNMNLSTPTTISLGDPNNSPFIKEGDSLNITVTGSSTHLYGLITSSNPDGSVYSLDLYNSLSNDTIANAPPTSGQKKAFSNTIVTQILPANTKLSMGLQGEIPLTFINGTNNVDKTKNQISYYDCKSDPYKITGSVIVTDNYCQPKPPYTPSCVRKILSDGGCTSAGNWYQSGSLPGSILGSNLVYIKDWLATRVKNAESEPDTFTGCYGVNRRNACAAFVGTNSVPSKECLQALYDNTITKGNLVSTANIKPYLAAGENFLNYRALNGNTDRYCRSSGYVNPSSGDPTLSNIALGYSSGGATLKGMAAVNQYLSDIYTRAINDELDIHKPDSEGGRQTSWNKCFGISIASKKSIPVNNLSDTKSCVEIRGKKNVYLLENSDPSFSLNSYESTGIPNTYWIWGDQTYSAKTFTFFYNYCNGNGAFTGTLEGQLRSSGTVSINGSVVPTGEKIARTVPIIVGNNEIRVTATGTAARAGFWLVLKDSSGMVLMKTDETWRCE